MGIFSETRAQKRVAAGDGSCKVDTIAAHRHRIGNGIAFYFDLNRFSREYFGLKFSEIDSTIFFVNQPNPGY